MSFSSTADVPALRHSVFVCANTAVCSTTAQKSFSLQSKHLKLSQNTNNTTKDKQAKVFTYCASFCWNVRRKRPLLANLRCWEVRDSGYAMSLGLAAKRGVNNTDLLWDGPCCCLVTNILGREPGKHVPPPQETRRSLVTAAGV